MQVKIQRMGIPTRFAFWLMPRAIDLYFQLINIWWITLLLTLSLSLFLAQDYGSGMLWIMGIPMVLATLVPVILILTACWADIRAKDWNRENQAQYR